MAKDKIPLIDLSRVVPANVSPAHSNKSQVFCLICCAIAFIPLCFQLYIVQSSSRPTRFQDPQLKILRQQALVAYQAQTRGQNESKIWCQFPRLTPMHESIQDVVEEPRKVSCRNEPQWPHLFASPITADPILIQVNKPEEFGFKNCCYHPDPVARRKYSNENLEKIDDLDATYCKPITENMTRIPKNIEFLAVLCEPIIAITPKSEATKSRRMVVDMFLFTPTKEPQFPMPQNPKERLEKLNVVILGLDSVSHMGFLRSMPLTYLYLTKNLSAFGMNVYSSLGHNTFTNAIPILTGSSAAEFRKSCWPSRRSSSDNCYFIWKDFSKAGYLTSFGEDGVDGGIFEYKAQGFVNPPVDYYINRFNKIQELEIEHEFNGMCYGPRLALSVLLNYIQRFAASRTKESRYFQFIWATSLFHEDMNLHLLGDEYLLQTLQWFKTEGHLENTVFFLTSDHGSRSGRIRALEQGKNEARMPFLYMLLPKWFQNKYPLAMKNYYENQNRLATSLDLHATVKEFLNPDNLSDEKIRLRSKDVDISLQKGISLFLPIPVNRTCENASIEPLMCFCTSMVRADPNDLGIKNAAKVLVDHINGIITGFPSCSKLELQKIVKAEYQIDPSSTGIYEGKFDMDEVQNTVITIETRPGEALYEASLARKSIFHSNSDLKVVGLVSRINTYRGQDVCMDDRFIKPYCYCKK